MIEIGVLIWLCIKNAREAQANAHMPVGYVFMTIGLWFGMEICGAIFGLLIGGGSTICMYFFALVFAVAGGYISHRIVANLPQGNYIPKEKAQPLAEPAQITVVRESSVLSKSDIWDFSLNGVLIGRINDGDSLTVTTDRRNNIIVARNYNGTLCQPLEFFVDNRWQSTITFRAGRFVSAQKTGILEAGQGEPAAQGAGAEQQ